jgi:hypothetical protein
VVSVEKLISYPAEFAQIETLKNALESQLFKIRKV